MLLKIVFLISLCVLLNTANGARILGVFPMAAPSHYILGKALLEGLAEAGHDVTLISPYENKHPPKKGSYRDIILTGYVEEFDELVKKMNLLDTKNQSMIDTVITFLGVMTQFGDDLYNHENVKKLLNSDEKFDLVIVEQFLNDNNKILGHYYNVPTVLLSSVGANIFVNQIVGNPSPLSYITEMHTTSEHLSFTERILNVLAYIFFNAVAYFYFIPDQNRILNRHFSNPPHLYDLFDNVSIVLLNSHESLHQAVPYVPNMIQIGGFHIKPPKKLPEDLQKYLDDAKDGVVYFSLGSNLKSKNLPAEKRDAFLTALGKLKQKVLWKWEDEDLPGKPPNVKTSKWLPQQDILAHPNVKLFITHCGLLSTTETVYHGVPILAIPVFADQYRNAENAVRSGYALTLPYEDPSFSEEKLSEKLQEILTNPQYTNNVKKRSQIFHDRPQKPMETAVYWVEYVIRNNGAPHLKVAGTKLSWAVYHSLDVVAFIVATLSLIVYLLYVSIRKVVIYRKSCKKQKTKSKIN